MEGPCTSELDCAGSGGGVESYKLKCSLWGDEEYERHRYSSQVKYIPRLISKD